MAVSRRVVLGAGAALIGAGAASDAFATDRQPNDPITNIPEYTPGAPVRRSFVSDATSGERLRVFGRALTTSGAPIAGAQLDFWHTDSRGVYDTAGHRFRGRQRTDHRGAFVLDTVMPGSYGNPLHVHYLLVAHQRTPQPIMLSSAIYIPTEKEYADHADWHRMTEFLPPDTVPVIDGVRMAHCDIIAEPAPMHARGALAPTYAWREVTDHYGWLPGAPGPPTRSSLLEPGDVGERLVISGRVLTRAGAPIADARLEFWNADAAGPYDRVGYRLRGMQRSRPDGGFAVETLMPTSAGVTRRIDYLASALLPGRHQPLYVHAGIFLASDEELNQRVDRDARPLVRPGARTYGDDSAFLRMSALPVESSVRRASYDIVFDVA